MRTVQEILRELNTEHLIDIYLDKYPVGCEDMVGRPFLSTYEMKRQVLADYIERLRSMSPKKPETGQVCLFYAYKYIINETTQVAFDLIIPEEFLMNGYDCESYSCIFHKQSEIIGYLVAETPLMSHHLYELMSEVMRDAAFFGMEQQHLKSVQDRLGKMIRDSNNDMASRHPWDELKPEWETDGLSDEESVDKGTIHESTWEAFNVYRQYSKREELDMVCALLHEERSA